MTYNTNIPQGTDPILQSQGQIRPNFQEINRVFSNNHVGINDDFKGQHNVLTMRPQVGDPITSATQVAIYNKLVSTLPNLFYMPNNTQTPIQLTYPSLNTSSSSNEQYSFVAGPFVVYMGKKVNVANGQNVVLLPATTLIYVGLTSVNVSGVGLTISNVPIPINIVGNSFDIAIDPALSGGNVDVFYLAIGA